MTKESKNRLSKPQVLALRGIRLPAFALKLLQQTGIFCDPSVSIEYQYLAKQHVLRGRESGGAAGHTGAYCGFVDSCGEPLSWLSRVETVGRNGIHAVAVAPELVRIHVFRNGQTYELLVTQHALKFKSEGTRPMLENSILFHGLHGTLPLESSNEEIDQQSETLPLFYTRSGEPLAIPEIFRNGVIRTVAGCRCSGCRHCHVMKPGAALTTALFEEGRP
jgi:hypothetical protein